MNSDIRTFKLSFQQAAIEEDMKKQGSIVDVVGTRGNRMALVLTCGLVGFQQLSGINVVLFYAENIFQMTGASFSPSISAIIIGTVLNISAVSAPLLTKLFGIKLLLIVSEIGMMAFQVRKKNRNIDW